MKGLWVITGFICSIALAVPVRAAPSVPSETERLVQTFAYCAGRLSAEIEHRWLMGMTTTNELERQRRATIDLLEATMPPGIGPRVLEWRITAKHSHARLLQTADLSPVAKTGRRAQRLARARLSECTGMMLT